MIEDFSIITVHGNYEAYVENFIKILDFGTDLIKIKATKMIVEFFGRNLYIEFMTRENLKVCGQIENIKFTEVLS